MSGTPACVGQATRHAARSRDSLRCIGGTGVTLTLKQYNGFDVSPTTTTEHYCIDYRICQCKLLNYPLLFNYENCLFQVHLALFGKLIQIQCVERTIIHKKILTCENVHYRNS